MKVLHLVSASTLTGPADPALGMARGLRDHMSLEVWIAFDALREGNMRDKVEESGLPVLHGLELSTKSAPWRMLADARMLRREASSFDIVHVHTSHDHGVAVLGGIRPPVIRSLHHPRTAERRFGQGLVYARTQGFTAVSESVQRALFESYPSARRCPTAVVPGAVDTERFSPGSDLGAFRASLGVPADAFLLGHLSRIKEGRGHDMLVEAVRRVTSGPGASSSLCVAFIGKGEGEDALKGAIARAGLESRTFFFGFRDADLPDALRACDFTVLLREGNDAGCRAVLESMACGVPVLGAALPAISEAFGGGGGGFSFPVDDIEGLCAALKQALALPAAERARMGEAARRTILSRHTETRRAELVLQLYRDVLSRGPR